MTPLRQKMIKAMELRNFSKHNQRGYLKAVYTKKKMVLMKNDMSIQKSI